MCFLPLLPNAITLDELNRRLEDWIAEYHEKEHSSIAQPPLERYLAGIHLIRKAPAEIEAYFRTRVCRLVNKDRSVSLNSHLFEAPVGLVGKKVELVFSEAEPLNVEVVFDGNSWGKLAVLYQQINSKVHRSDYEPKRKDNPTAKPEETVLPQGGRLFESGGSK